MYLDVKQVVTVGKNAVLSKILQQGVRLLVIGETLVGKSTLVSACIGQPVSFEAHTIRFATNSSSITEINGLHTTNKNRGHVWRAIIDFIAINKTDAVWFCVGSDFVDNNDELWHWMNCLSQVCQVILVRTKCLSPAQALVDEVSNRFPTSPPPVVSVLARDMQLNPKGGGAVVEAYGVDDLASITEETLRKKQSFAKDAISKLQKQVTRDEERYASEEAHKEALLNSLRTLSGTDETPKKEPSKKDSLGDEDFELIPRPESPGSGFVHMVKSKQARAAVGALVAFAVIRQLAYMHQH